MPGHLAYTEGSPSATLVLSALGFPVELRELVTAMRPVWEWATRRSGSQITKVALIAPSATPGSHLDYRFVQLLPGLTPEIELRGSCGHSILAAVVAASRHGFTAPLTSCRRVRVEVLNNGDRVECEVAWTSPPLYRISAHFLREPATKLAELMLTGQPVTVIAPGRPDLPRELTASLVTAGNPYIFVNATDLGVADCDQLFGPAPRLFETMAALRLDATRLLGWEAEGVFPKIAALLPDGPSGLAVRAISVPSWHPTLALTGAVCTAVAAGISGTVPQRLAFGQGNSPAPPHGVQLRIRTPGGTTKVSAVFGRAPGGPVLTRAGVCGKLVRDLGEVTLPHLAAVAQ
jgi:2-methylaconitate cis-trans-isomerase PrpF